MYLSICTLVDYKKSATNQVAFCRKKKKKKVRPVVVLFITESFWMNTCKMTSVYAHSRRITTKGAHGYLVCKMKENKEVAKGREKPVRCG